MFPNFNKPIVDTIPLSFDTIPFYNSKNKPSGKTMIDYYENGWYVNKREGFYYQEVDNVEKKIYNTSQGIDLILGRSRMKTINEGWYMQNYCEYLNQQTIKDIYTDIDINVDNSYEKFEEFYKNDSKKCEKLSKIAIIGRILRASNYSRLDFEKLDDNPPIAYGTLGGDPYIFLGYSIIETPKGYDINKLDLSLRIYEETERSIWFSPDGYFVNNDYKIYEQHDTYEMVRFDEKNGYFRFLKRQDITGWINTKNIPNIGGKKKRKSNKKKRKNNNRKRTNRKRIIRK